MAFRNTLFCQDILLQVQMQVNIISDSDLLHDTGYAVYSSPKFQRSNELCHSRMDWKATRMTSWKANRFRKEKWNEIEQVSDLWKLTHWLEISQVKDRVKLLNLVLTCNRMVNLFGQIQWMFKPCKAPVQRIGGDIKTHNKVTQCTDQWQFSN